jgi:hypothetical protein
VFQRHRAREIRYPLMDLARERGLRFRALLPGQPGAAPGYGYITLALFTATEGDGQVA